MRDRFAWDEADQIVILTPRKPEEEEDPNEERFSGNDKGRRYGE